MISNKKFLTKWGFNYTKVACLRCETNEEVYPPEIRWLARGRGVSVVGCRVSTMCASWFWLT